MDPGVSALVGAALGAGALLIAQLVSNAHQRSIAREDWLRGRLYEIYENVLTHLSGPDYNARDRWLDLLVIYFPSSAEPELATFMDKIRRGAVRRHDVVGLALSDKRLGKGRLPVSTAKLLAPPGEE